jgi:hypothetical protein
LRLADLTAGEGPFPSNIGYSRALGFAASQPEGGEFSQGKKLAPQTGFGLSAFWLTALVVFSEPDTQTLADGVRRCCWRLGEVGHVGDDFSKDAVDVLQGRVGDPAWAADEMTRGIQIGIVAARVAMAGETNEGHITRRHGRLRAGFPL